VSEWRVAGYVAIFERAHNLKSVTDDFLAILLGSKPATDGGT
jgi:hypothetical protein